MAADALPIHVADVLEGEYELLHGKLPPGDDPWSITAKQIRPEGLKLIDDATPSQPQQPASK